MARLPDYVRRIETAAGVRYEVPSLVEEEKLTDAGAQGLAHGRRSAAWPMDM